MFTDRDVREAIRIAVGKSNLSEDIYIAHTQEENPPQKPFIIIGSSSDFSMRNKAKFEKRGAIGCYKVLGNSYEDTESIILDECKF